MQLISGGNTSACLYFRRAEDLLITRFQQWNSRRRRRPLLLPKSLVMASRHTVRPFIGLTRVCATAIECPISSRRPLSYALKPANIQRSQRTNNRSLPSLPFRQSTRRSYADVAPKPKRRLRGFFRLTWRLTYLSAIGGFGYLTYRIYQIRTPTEQYAPDPAKKTLVILGWFARNTDIGKALTSDRHWMGRCIAH